MTTDEAAVAGVATAPEPDPAAPVEPAAGSRAPGGAAGGRAAAALAEPTDLAGRVARLVGTGRILLLDGAGSTLIDPLHAAGCRVVRVRLPVAPPAPATQRVPGPQAWGEAAPRPSRLGEAAPAAGSTPVGRPELPGSSDGQVAGESAEMSGVGEPAPSMRPARSENGAERELLAEADPRAVAAALRGERFDALVVLAPWFCLDEPAELLRALVPLLRPHGVVVAAVPNGLHASVRLAVLTGTVAEAAAATGGRAPHVRLYTRASALALFEAAGLAVSRLERQTTPLAAAALAVDYPELSPELIEQLARDPEARTSHFIITAWAAPLGRSPLGLSPENQRVELGLSPENQRVDQIRVDEMPVDQMPERVAELAAALGQAQARIDALMLEVEAARRERDELAAEVARQADQIALDEKRLGMLLERESELRALLVHARRQLAARNEAYALLERNRDEQTAWALRSVKVVEEANEVIKALQAEMQTKVEERDAMIRSLQAEMQARVEERDATIRALNATLPMRLWRAPRALLRRLRRLLGSGA